MAKRLGSPKKLRRSVPRAEKPEKAPRKSLAAGETAMAVLPAEVESVVLADGFNISVNGLVVEGEPTFEACGRVGMTLVVTEKSAPFAVGDFVNYVEARFGEQAAQIIDPGNGWSLDTVKTYLWLARSIAPDVRRMDRLGVRHHMLVAKSAFAPGKQREWLNRAADSEDEPWTVGRLKAALENGGDLEVTGWWVLVACNSAEDQARFVSEMVTAGRSAKATERRRKVKKPARKEGG